MNRERDFGPGLGEAVPVAPDEPLPRTALPVLSGRPRHLEAHLGRLEAGARALGFPAAWVGALQGQIEAWLAASLGPEDAALRLLLRPGPGLLAARLEPLPAAPSPCRLMPMAHPLGARRAEVQVTHKGLGGPWGAPLLAEARRLGAEDALLLWPDGTLAETTLAAVGVEAEGVLRLPPPPGRVASLAERLDLPAWAEARGLRLERTELSLAQAREGRVWCLNALRGIWPATLL